MGSSTISYTAAKAIQQTDLHGEFDIQAIHTAYRNNTMPLKTYKELQCRFVACLSNKFVMDSRNKIYERDV